MAACPSPFRVVSAGRAERIPIFLRSAPIKVCAQPRANQRKAAPLPEISSVLFWTSPHQSRIPMNSPNCLQTGLHRPNTVLGSSHRTFRIESGQHFWHVQPGTQPAAILRSSSCLPLGCSLIAPVWFFFCCPCPVEAMIVATVRTLAPPVLRSRRIAAASCEATVVSAQTIAPPADTTFSLQTMRTPARPRSATSTAFRDVEARTACTTYPTHARNAPTRLL